MKGFQDIKNLVEVDKAWDEQLGLAVGVAIAEDIYPKRIEGIKRFDTYRMEILKGRINVALIQDRRLAWKGSADLDELLESGDYFLYSEIEKIRNFIVIEGMMIPPSFHKIRPEYAGYGIKCEIEGEDGQLVATMSDIHHNDQAIFKSMRMVSAGNEFSRTHKTYFSLVFGFNSPIKTSKIKIIPKESKKFNFGGQFLLWYRNDDFFPRENFGKEKDGVAY